MTDKEIVLKNYPSARSEKIKEKGKSPFWIIKMASATMPFATGKTARHAWNDAKYKMGKQNF